MTTRQLFNPYKLGLMVALFVLVWLVVTIMGDSGLGRISELETQIGAQQVKVAALIERNELMANEVGVLKTDPSQMELLARYHLGMIKPGEVYIQMPGK